MSIDRRQFIRGAGAATLAGLSPAAWSQQRGPIRLFVGFPPGGLPDLVARALAEQLRKSFDVPAVVENRAGANGRIAGQAVKAAAADGNTLLVAPASNLVHLAHVYTDLGYDVLTDFAPVAQVVENDFALAISSKIPAKNLQEFAAWCRANPTKATFASPGTGSAPHLMGLQIGRALNIPFSHVPYKGSNFALTDLAGGHIASMVASTSFMLQPLKSGSLRILAVTGNARSTVLPDVPTFKESGLAQLTLTEGTWLLAPAKTPAPVVERLAAAALESLKGKEMAGVLDGVTVAAPLGPRDLARVMREEYDKRGAIIKAFGFTANQ